MSSRYAHSPDPGTCAAGRVAHRATALPALTRPAHRASRAQMIGDDSNAVVLPRSVGMAMAFGVQNLPDAWLTCDQLRMQSVETTMPAGEPGLEELGITDPGHIEDIAERYLMRFKKQSHFQDLEEKKIIQAPR